MCAAFEPRSLGFDAGDARVSGGVTTNHCCETTARVGAASSATTSRFVLDARHTFDRRDPAGGVVTANELTRVIAAKLYGEFATVIETATALRA